MNRYSFASILLASAAIAQTPIACYDFDNNSVSSVQPAFASVSDLTISNDFVFGGTSSDAWLCLSTQWNNSGGTIRFLVTPNAGESIDFSSFEWSAVTNNPAVSDSVAAMTLFANGALVATVDPLSHNTVHSIDLSTYDALQGATTAVIFVMDFTGNPTGQSSYEVADLKVGGDRCVLNIGGVTPGSLPVVTPDCFTLTGDCFDQVTDVKWDGTSLPVCTPANWGQGCYEIVDAHTLKVCPPLCLAVNTYPIELLRGNETSTQNVDLFLSVNGVTACPATHPAGTDLCLAVSTGQLPQPNAVFVILSPTDLPSIIPGIIEMDLGNMLQDYICGPGHTGECVEECYAIPASLAGTTWHFQSIVWNPFQTVLPFPVTNLCSTTSY